MKNVFFLYNEKKLLLQKLGLLFLLENRLRSRHHFLLLSGKNICFEYLLITKCKGKRYISKMYIILQNWCGSNRLDGTTDYKGDNIAYSCPLKIVLLSVRN